MDRRVMEILSQSDFYFWGLLIAASAWMWGSVHVTLWAHRRINELRSECQAKREEIDALRREIEELKRTNPFRWSRAN